MAGWLVDDVEKVVDELTANGVEFERYEGTDVETDEELTVGWFYPTPDSWSSGDPKGKLRAVRNLLTRERPSKPLSKAHDGH